MLALLVKWLTGGFADKLVSLGQSYFQKQISEAEFRAEVEKAAQEAATRTEAAWADAATKIAATTGDTLKASVILQRAFAVTLFLQVAVLVWFQIGAGAFELISGSRWPSPGVTLEYAYLLVGCMIGAGPFVFRRG